MTVRQNILDGKYDPGQLPVAPQRPIPVFSYGSAHAGSADYRHYADALDAYEARMAEYRASLEQYTKDQSLLMRLFAHDLAEENGIAEHPRRGMVFDLALRCADGLGMNDIADWYRDLAQLIR